MSYLDLLDEYVTSDILKMVRLMNRGDRPKIHLPIRIFRDLGIYCKNTLDNEADKRSNLIDSYNVIKNGDAKLAYHVYCLIRDHPWTYNGNIESYYWAIKNYR